MKQTDQSFEDLVGQLHTARQRRPKKYSLSGTDYWVFGIAGALALAFIIWGHSLSGVSSPRPVWALSRP
ncbi:MAG: hypothetical protein ACTH8R_12990, partial [Glutamicibacter arilaitensis]